MTVNDVKQYITMVKAVSDEKLKPIIDSMTGLIADAFTAGFECGVYSHKHITTYDNEVSNETLKEN